MSLSFKTYTLGCKVNQYDSNRIEDDLKSLGLVKAVDQAQLAIINSCAVTNNATKKSLLAIKRAKKECPGAKIVLLGCWPKISSLNPDKLGVNLILHNKEASDILSGLKINNSKRKNHLQPARKTGRSRYFLKIEDGCEQYCSYCIIPYARGPVVSRSEKEILDEIRQATALGYKEIILSGIHLGLYGRGANDKKNSLTGLISRAVKIEGLGRIRLSSIEITEINKKLIKLITQNTNLCRHLHIPLQSGSDKILKLMRRPYDTNYFEQKINFIKQAMPNIALTTDVIVGFPGETERDYQATISFIKKIGFSRLHVFPYSAHEKTPAAKFADQVEEKIKQIRAAKLRIISQKLEALYVRQFKNKTLEVVIEREGESKLIGKTEFYFDFTLKKNPNKQIHPGNLILVKFRRYKGYETNLI